MRPDGARVLIGAVLALVLASPAWGAHKLEDVRVGKHPTFTRVVFELDQAAGYRIEKKEIAGLAELVVSLEAAGSSGEVAVPKSLIESIQLQTDGRRTVAHIRLARAGLRIKEMTLREPARIVIDVIDNAAVAATPKAAPAPKPAAKTKSQATQAKAEAVKPKPEAAPPPKVEPKPAAVPPPRTASAPATPPKPEPAAVPAPAPVAVKTPRPTAAPTATLVDPPSKARLVEKPKPDADDDVADARSSQASDWDTEELAANLPSDPTAPSADAEPKVPAASKPSKGGMRTSLPGASPPTSEDSEGGLFTVGNAGYVLAGIALLVAVSYGVARRRGGRQDFEDFDDDELDDDNPFAGLEAAQSESETADANEQVADASDDDQTDLFAGTPAASPGASPVSEPIKTEGSDMSMDMTSDFSADPEAMTTLSGAPAGGTDMEGVMRMVRELATRVGDLETRLEDAIDSKERLERQVAAQTEELRVQRAAIARTQRAVRNMSQPVEDTPTEPAPRAPRAEDQ